MISKKLDFSSNCVKRLNYIYRGENHEHKVSTISHIGGNTLSENPIIKDGEGNIVRVDIHEIKNEFEKQAELHKGNGSKLYGHYVISLAPGESLLESEWLHVASDYMESLGYDNTTIWTAVVHYDSLCQHAHILACRVKNDQGFKLVSDKNDYTMGHKSMRRLEEIYNIKRVRNPEENWGREFPNNKSKRSIYEGDPDGCVDDAVIIRRRLSDIWKKKPSTMSEFAKSLNRKGIEVKIKTNLNNDPIGINYRLRERESWISGSKIKPTRATWTKLIEREGISYKPWRDNSALGLESRKEGYTQDSIDPNFIVCIHLSSQQLRRLKVSSKGKKVRIYQSNNQNNFARLDFRLSLTPDQKKQLHLEKRMSIAMNLIQEAIERILCEFFGHRKEKYIYRNENLIPKDWVEQSSHAYDSKSTIKANTLASLHYEIDQATKWRSRVKHDNDHSMIMN